MSRNSLETRGRLAHPLDLGDEAFDDGGERDLVDVDFLAVDEVKEEVEWSLEHRRRDRVRHPGQVTRVKFPPGAMRPAPR